MKREMMGSLLAAALLSCTTACGERERTSPTGESASPRSESSRQAAGAATGTERRPTPAAPHAGAWMITWAGLEHNPSEGEKELIDISEVEHLMSRIDPDGWGFVILTDPHGRFMQVALDRDGYVLEFHDPLAERCALLADKVSADTVRQAFGSFHRGHPGFPEDPGWIRIGVDGAPLDR